MISFVKSTLSYSFHYNAALALLVVAGCSTNDSTSPKPASVETSKDKVVYGNDDRQDVYAYSDQEWAARVAEFTPALISILAEIQSALPELYEAARFEGLEDLLSEEATEKVKKETELLLDQAVQLKPQREYVVVMCAEDGGIEFERLRSLLGLAMVRKGGYRPGSPFDTPGVQRVIHASELIARLEEQS